MNVRVGRVALGLVTTVVAMATIAAVVQDRRHVRDARGRAEADLAAVDEATDDLRDDIAASESEVDARRTTLEGEESTLELRAAERDEAQAFLEGAQSWLATMDGRLGASSAAVGTQSEELANLQACVAGLAEALNQSGAHDAGGLAATMAGIEATCAAAGASP